MKSTDHIQLLAIFSMAVLSACTSPTQLSPRWLATQTIQGHDTDRSTLGTAQLEITNATDSNLHLPLQGSPRFRLVSGQDTFPMKVSAQAGATVFTIFPQKTDTLILHLQLPAFPPELHRKESISQIMRNGVLEACQPFKEEACKWTAVPKALGFAHFEG